MSVFNESLSRVDDLLVNPKEQMPSISMRFTHLTYEFQQLYNELSNSGKPWTYNTVSVTVNPGTTDYVVPNASGRVMFVMAYPVDANYNPVSLEFADLADVSADFWPYSPLDFGLAKDFNEAWTLPFPFQIAFYRKDGELWFRLPPFAMTLTNIDVIFSTGDWIENLSTGDAAVLSQHHQLAEVRAAMNLLPAAEWTDDAAMNDAKRAALAQSLPEQEARYAREFLYAKRSLTRDMPVVRAAFGEWY